MITDTHCHLRITQSDRCLAKSVHLMKQSEWKSKLRRMLIRNGFDMGRIDDITVTGTACDRIFSQERVAV